MYTVQTGERLWPVGKRWMVLWTFYSLNRQYVTSGLVIYHAHNYHDDDHDDDHQDNDDHDDDHDDHGDHDDDHEEHAKVVMVVSSP